MKALHLNKYATVRNADLSLCCGRRSSMSGSAHYIHQSRNLVRMQSAICRAIRGEVLFLFSRSVVFDNPIAIIIKIKLNNFNKMEYSFSEPTIVDILLPRILVHPTSTKIISSLLQMPSLSNSEIVICLCATLLIGLPCICLLPRVHHVSFLPNSIPLLASSTSILDLVTLVGATIYVMNMRGLNTPALPLRGWSVWTGFTRKDGVRVRTWIVEHDLSEDGFHRVAVFPALPTLIGSGLVRGISRR